MIKIILTIATTIVLTGCATWSTSNTYFPEEKKQTHTARKKTSPENIIITTTDMLNRKYIVIADISVSIHKTAIFNKDPAIGQVNEKLKSKAAELGADAVIMVRYGNLGASLLSWGTLNGKGRAIYFIN